MSVSRKHLQQLPFSDRASDAPAGGFRDVLKFQLGAAQASVANASTSTVDWANGAASTVAGYTVYNYFASSDVSISDAGVLTLTKPGLYLVKASLAVTVPNPANSDGEMVSVQLLQTQPKAAVAGVSMLEQTVLARSSQFVPNNAAETHYFTVSANVQTNSTGTPTTVAVQVTGVRATNKTVAVAGSILEVTRLMGV